MTTNHTDNSLLQTDAWPPVPWTRRDIVLALVLGAVFTVGLVVVLVGGATLFLQLAKGQLPSSLLGFFTLVAELGFLLPVWLLGVRKYHLTWSSVGFRRCNASHALGLGCLFLLISLAASFVWSMLLSFIRHPLQQDLAKLFGGEVGGLTLALLAAGVIAPIAEEAFFRGYLFAGLYQHVGFRKAMVLSAAIFAVAHVLPTTWPPLFVLGLLFASLYEQSGSLWPAIILHSFINSLALVAAYLAPLMQS